MRWLVVGARAYCRPDRLLCSVESVGVGYGRRAGRGGGFFELVEGVVSQDLTKLLFLVSLDPDEIVLKSNQVLLGLRRMVCEQFELFLGCFVYLVCPNHRLVRKTGGSRGDYEAP